MFRERERKGEGEGEKHGSFIAFPTPPTRYLAQQPRHVPWLGIEWVTFCFGDDAQLPEPVRAHKILEIMSKWMTQISILYPLSVF